MADETPIPAPDDKKPVEGTAPGSSPAAAGPDQTPAPAPTPAQPAPAKPAAATAATPGAAAGTPGAAATPAPEQQAKAPRAGSRGRGRKDAGAEAGKPALSLEGGEADRPKIIKAKGSKNVGSGIAHVLATFNNTIVSITDLNGNVIGWSSAGKVGFKGSRKSTAYAAQLVAQDACRQAMGHGLKEVEVLVKGPGAGRESAVRAIQAIGLDISVIRDVTPVPHNGCRPPKQRRV